MQFGTAFFLYAVIVSLFAFPHRSAVFLSLEFAAAQPFPGGGGPPDVADCPNAVVIPPPPLERLFLEYTVRDPFCCLVDGEDGESRGGVFPFLVTGCPRRLDAETFCRGAETLPELVDVPYTGLLPSATTDGVAAVTGVGSTSMCFNVYSGDATRDSLPCANSLIGNPATTFKEIVNGVSILAAGNVFIFRQVPDGPRISGKLIAGGNLNEVSTSAAEIAKIAICCGSDNACLLQTLEPFAGNALWVGGNINHGNIAPPLSGFSVLNGDAAIANPEDASSISVATPVVSSPATVRLGRETIVARLCSAATQFINLARTGTVSGTTNLVYECEDPGVGNLCVLDVTAEQLAVAVRVASITFLAPRIFDVVIRVSGAGEVNLPALTAPTDVGLIYLFTEAETVNINIPPAHMYNFPIFAPFASSVSVNFAADTVFRGPLVLGRSDSTIILNNFSTTIEEPLFMGVDGQVPRNREFDCDCACNPNDLPHAKATPSCIAKKCDPDAQCPDIEDYLCASNHISYKNLCFFENAKCRDPSLTIKARDFCLKTATPPPPVTGTETATISTFTTATITGSPASAG